MNIIHLLLGSNLIKMKKRIIYIILIIIIGLFIYLSIISETNFNKWIFSIGANWSLFFMIFKYFLDENKQLNDHYLNSNIVHDIYLKLTDFWNEYIKKLYETFDFLTERWENKEILNYARDLYFIRRKYTIYLNDKISEKLKNFEWELRFIWANTWLLESIEVGTRRNEIIDKIYKKLLIIMDQKIENEEKISSTEDIISEIKKMIWATKIIEKRNTLI